MQMLVSILVFKSWCVFFFTTLYFGTMSECIENQQT